MNPKPPTHRDPPYGMYVILAGLFAMTAVALSSIFHYGNATEVVTALGPVTGVIGSLVGAYFGLRGSSLAQQNASDAESKRTDATGATP